LNRIVTAVVALAAVGVAAPAQGLTARVSDPRDVPATSDITSVTYRNGEVTTGTVVHVRDLRRTGILAVDIAVPDSDFGFTANVWIRSDGSLGKRLQSFSDTGTGSARCPGLSASWSTVRNVVAVTVPHACLRVLGFLTREYFQARFRANRRTDTALSRVVGRGSSPGCVTRSEFDAVRIGATRERVHAVWDTAGVVEGSRGSTDQQRQYRVCSDSKSIVRAEFVKRTDNVWHLIRKRGFST